MVGGGIQLALIFSSASKSERDEVGVSTHYIEKWTTIQEFYFQPTSFTCLGWKKHIWGYAGIQNITHIPHLWTDANQIVDELEQTARWEKIKKYSQ